MNRYNHFGYNIKYLTDTQILCGDSFFDPILIECFLTPELQFSKINKENTRVTVKQLIAMLKSQFNTNKISCQNILALGSSKASGHYIEYYMLFTSYFQFESTRHKFLILLISLYLQPILVLCFAILESMFLFIFSVIKKQVA